MIAIQTNNLTGLNITSTATLLAAALTNSASHALIRPSVLLTNLNAAAATIDCIVRNTTDGADVRTFAIAKRTASDTAVEVSFPAFVAQPSKVYAILFRSSNASDTNVSASIAWTAESRVDLRQINGTNVASGSMLIQASQGLALGDINFDSLTLNGLSLTGADGYAPLTILENPNPGDPAIYVAGNISVAGTMTATGGLVSVSTLLGTSTVDPADVWNHPTRTLTAGRATVVSVLSNTGTLTLIRGDEYSVATGNPVVVTIPWTKPTPDSVHIALYSKEQMDLGTGPTTTVAGTFTLATGTLATTFSLSAAALSALAVPDGNLFFGAYRVVARFGASRSSVVEGAIVLKN